LITNEESFERFKFRSNFTKAVREFYWKNNFMEVETPVLGNSASGAAAQPFITHLYPPLIHLIVINCHLLLPPTDSLNTS